MVKETFANKTPKMKRKYDCVPELSLKAYTDGGPTDRKAFQEALFEGFKYFGFIILKAHPIRPELFHTSYELSSEFFTLQDEEKLLFSRPDGQRGYTLFECQHAKDSEHPELKEFWHVGREFEGNSALADVFPPNMRPARPEQFRETFFEIYNALEEAGMVMLEALAPSLDVDDEYFRRMTTNGNSIVCLLHYPPVPDGVSPNAPRATAHEDINLITILVAANGGSLELLDHEGNWLPVETDPNNLIVDAGDMLARVCNDLVPATTHRVVIPDCPNISCYSMPFFMHPHPDATLTCLESCKGDAAKYSDIIADHFLKQRLAEIGLAG